MVLETDAKCPDCEWVGCYSECVLEQVAVGFDQDDVDTRLSCPQCGANIRSL